MILLAFRNLTRRPMRTGLTVAGLAIAVAVLVCLSSFGNGYKRALRSEVDRMGVQLMLVPLGCPYDAAARVLKAKSLEFSLPESVLVEARQDPAVAVAAPLLLAAMPRPEAGRADMWAGIDMAALELKPWWRTRLGEKWFTSANSAILGADAAEVELRSPGDRLYSPETERQLRVAAILQRSGTSDDSLFFVPLQTAQEMFKLPGRLTAVAIRLRDPSLLRVASERLQRIPGAQVVTLTEMMGTFLNLVGAVRTLLFSIALVAVAISVLSIFNTQLAAVLERTGELSILRAIGASRSQILRLITTEALLLAGMGSFAGIVLAVVIGREVETLVKGLLPLAPSESLLLPTAKIVLETAVLGGMMGVLGGVYPAWRAAQLHPAEASKAD
jgi:putative ABC transport system permease protein